MIEEINDNKNIEFENQLQELIQSLSQEPSPSEERLARIKDRVIEKNFPGHFGKAESQSGRFETQVSTQAAKINATGNFFSRLWINHSTFIITSVSLITIGGVALVSNLFFGNPSQEKNIPLRQQTEMDSSYINEQKNITQTITQANGSSSSEEKSGSISDNSDQKQVPEGQSISPDNSGNVINPIDKKKQVPDEQSFSRNKSGDVASLSDKKQTSEGKSNPPDKSGSITNPTNKKQTNEEDSFQEPIPKGTKVTKREIAFITIQTTQFKDERFDKAFKEINSFFERKAMAFSSKGNKLITRWNYFRGLNPDLCLRLRISINKESRGNLDGIVIRTEEYSQDIKKVPEKMITDISLKKFFDDLQREIIKIFKGQPTLK